MTQALHILRKDIRHQWPDITIYLTLLVLFAVVTPMLWPGTWSSNELLPLLSTLLSITIPLCWFFILARLVQEESLVGDRQFWTTRPYRWNSLLAAKLLFVTFFIGLPYLAMQSALAIYAGVSPFHAGIVITTMKVALIVWTPFLLAAAVTSSVSMAFFSMLGTVILWLVVLVFIASRDQPLADTPYVFPLFSILFACIFGGILLLLYRKRSIKLGRILFISSAVLFLILVGGFAKLSPASPGNLLMKARYPADAAQELHLVYDASAPHTAKDARESMHSSLVHVTLPIRLQGLKPGQRLDEASVQFQIEQGNYRYTSPWRPVFNFNGTMLIMVPSEAMDRAGNVASRLQITLAAQTIEPDETSTTPVTNRFRIPGNGTCVAANPPYEGPSSQTRVVCRYAFSIATPIDIQPHTEPGCARLMSPIKIPAYDTGTSPDPVFQRSINFGVNATMSLDAKNCRIQSLTTTVYRPVKRFRTTLDIPSITLRDYYDR